MQPAACVWPSLLTLDTLARAWREKIENVEFHQAFRITMVDREVFIWSSAAPSSASTFSHPRSSFNCYNLHGVPSNEEMMPEQWSSLSSIGEDFWQCGFMVQTITPRNLDAFTLWKYQCWTLCDMQVSGRLQLQTTQIFISCAKRTAVDSKRSASNKLADTQTEEGGWLFSATSSRLLTQPVLSYLKVSANVQWATPREAILHQIPVLCFKNFWKWEKL